jgi:hypothetical protein
MMLLIGFKKQLLHLFKLIESAISKTSWTVGFITVNASVTVFISIHYKFAFEAFHLSYFSYMGDHAL